MSLPVVTNQLNINLKFFGVTRETNHLKDIRRSNLKKLIFSHLTINSISNTFESVVKDLSSNVDLLVLSETKIDHSFPKGQFLIKGFGDPFRIYRNVNWGGIVSMWVILLLQVKLLFL